MLGEKVGKAPLQKWKSFYWQGMVAEYHSHLFFFASIIWRPPSKAWLPVSQLCLLFYFVQTSGQCHIRPWSLKFHWHPCETAKVGADHLLHSFLNHRHGIPCGACRAPILALPNQLCSPKSASDHILNMWLGSGWCSDSELQLSVTRQSQKCPQPMAQPTADHASVVTSLSSALSFQTQQTSSDDIY